MCFAATFCRYNMGSPSVNQLSWEDCCAACASDTNCAAWTWHKLFGAEPPRKPKCFLSAAKNVKAHSGGVDTCTSVPVYLFPRREHAYHPIVRVHTVQSTSVRSFAPPPLPLRCTRCGSPPAYDTQHYDSLTTHNTHLLRFPQDSPLLSIPTQWSTLLLTSSIYNPLPPTPPNSLYPLSLSFLRGWLQGPIAVADTTSTTIAITTSPTSPATIATASSNHTQATCAKQEATKHCIVRKSCCAI